MNDDLGASLVAQADGGKGRGLRVRVHFKVNHKLPDSQMLRRLAVLALLFSALQLLVNDAIEDAVAEGMKLECSVVADASFSITIVLTLKIKCKYLTELLLYLQKLLAEATLHLPVEISLVHLRVRVCPITMTIMNHLPQG